MKLEIEINGELEHVLDVLAEHAETQNGEKPTPEDVAEQLIREGASQRYQQLLMSE